MTPNPRIDRKDNAWKSLKMRAYFMQCRGVDPTEVHFKTVDNCDCCDHDQEESAHVSHHCELREFDFGPRWTFVMMEHKHVAGTTFKVDLDVYRDGAYQETFTYHDTATEFNSFVRAENKMLTVMGVPIEGHWAAVKEEVA